ncbi:hypothetical protein Syn7803C16_28 [Synechococcus phage ACG-2014f]|uniref:Uncharacterized protein n=1 Tax=Synechococcus phage ACG-2014f TaxID=1493511 RepID=A0A0E3I5S4_9CAUD|nr:hypothetical protein Syn7803C16_28 [Synechococcus phage ACG-2014f]AIX43667.1 hypothetical protein Syn7803C24_28 [Synechococcus phage ACG-2014f]
MTEGYVVIALGDKYVQLAKNFEDTLRQNGDNRPVHVVTEDMIDKDNDKYRDCDVPNERYNCYPKLHFNEYAIFDHSILIDADVLCVGDTQHVWDMCKEQEQFILHRGWGQVTKWNRELQKKVWDVHGFVPPRIHGAFCYLRKADINEDFFEFIQNNVWFQYTEWCTEDVKARHHRLSRSDQVIYAIGYGKFDLMPCQLMEVPIMTHILTAAHSNPPYDRITFKDQIGPDLQHPVAFAHIEQLFQESTPESFLR